MALSNADKVRRYRERQKVAKREKDRELAQEIYRKPFFEFFAPYERSFSELQLYFDMMGLDVPHFVDDSGPKSLSGEVETLSNKDDAHGFQSYKGSLGKAEVIMGALQSAAVELASIIQEYKISEIKARIGEAEAADFNDPVTKKAALAEILRFNKMLEQLQDKQVKWPIPQWRVVDE